MTLGVFVKKIVVSFAMVNFSTVYYLFCYKKEYFYFLYWVVSYLKFLDCYFYAFLADLLRLDYSGGEDMERVAINELLEVSVRFKCILGVFFLVLCAYYNLLFL